MRYFTGFFLLFCSVFCWAQISVSPSEPLQKDSFFNTNPPQKEAPKVKLLNANATKKDTKYGGNPYFEGDVVFEHQGSRLSADVVIWYQEQNFVKAIGNVKLLNADGSVITSEEMEYDGNTQKGLARKNVVLTDPKQTIRTETLYYERLQNKAFFNTGGTITNGQSTIYTRNGTYNIASRTISLNGNTKIEDKDYIVEGASIFQNQNTNIAEFSGPTVIINKKQPTNRVYTEKGSYNQNTQEVFLRKNSTIFYNGKTLKGDDMYYNQNTNFGKAKGNVTLNDPKEKRFIKGEYGEIYEKKDSAMVTEKAYAVKILEKDSVYFSSEKILAYQKLDSLQQKKSYLRAYHKARFFKTNIQARADSLSFNETDGVLHLFGNPIAWSDAKQVTGDKIEAYFDTENEYIDSLKVHGNAFAISKVDSMSTDDEFNQVKGKLMTVIYDKNEVKIAKVIGNAQAISYADETHEKTQETTRIGVGLSTCGILEALFEEKKMQILSCNIGAQTDIFPMSMIEDEKRFLPNFNWNTKDRLRKWTDIFLDSPNYPEKKYSSQNILYQTAQQELQKRKAQEERKKPKRVKK